MTDKCSNEKYGDMLHAYELNLLSESEREEFEIHLIECDICAERVEKMEAALALLQEDPGVNEAIEQIAESKTVEELEVKEDESGIRIRRRFWSAFVPSVAAAAAILIFLIIKPWHIEFYPTKEAVATENTLAIMYFENLVNRRDSERMGEIIASLLITDLSESEYLQIVSSQRLYDLMKMQGIEGARTIDRDIATEIARRANARWMMTGDILQIEPTIVMTSQIFDMVSGKVIASQKITGIEGEDIFSLVDKLTREVKKDLSLPEKALSEIDPMVADVTTHSAEAYRFYIEGIELYNRFYLNESADKFYKALKLDSTFAMAYYYLSHLGSYPENGRMIARASEFSDNLSTKEKYLIKVREAGLSGNKAEAISELKKLIKRYPYERYPHYLIAEYYYGQFKPNESIEHLKKAIEIYPLYKEAYNILAYNYAYVGDFEKAIETVDEYVELAPDEANPYDSRAEIYAKFGMIDKAIDSYKKALEVKPDFVSSLEMLGNLYLYQNDYATAESYYKKYAAVDKEWEPALTELHRSYINLFQGKIGRALSNLDSAIALSHKDSDPDWEYGTGGYLQWFKFKIMGEMESPGKVAREIEKTREIGEEYHTTQYVNLSVLYTELLAKNGEFDQAVETAEKIKKYLNNIDSESLHPYWYCVGYIEYVKGNFETAAEYFKKSTLMTLYPCYMMNFMLARTYIEMAQYQKAAQELEMVLTNYNIWQPHWSMWMIRSHYYLGLACEEMGQYSKAIERYEIFLKIWADTDSEIAELEMARKRLAKLKNNP